MQTKCNLVLYDTQAMAGSTGRLAHGPGGAG